jgi:hypothetical protein
MGHVYGVYVLKLEIIHISFVNSLPKRGPTPNNHETTTGQTASNGYVVDLLQTWWRRNGFARNISTRQDAVDKSVGGKML